MFELLLYYIIYHISYEDDEDKNVNVAHMKLQNCLFDLQCGVIRHTTQNKVPSLIFIGVFILYIFYTCTSLTVIHLFPIIYFADSD